MSLYGLLRPYYSELKSICIAYFLFKVAITFFANIRYLFHTYSQGIGFIMVSINQQPSHEPTVEFNQRCMDVLRQWEQGDISFDGAIHALVALSREAEANHQDINQGRAEQLLGYIQHYRGNLDASVHYNERARALYHRAGNLRRVAIIDLNQGENYRFKGDFVRAVRLYQSAQRIAEQYSDIAMLTMATVNEGLVLVTLGKNTEARRVLMRGLELAPQHPQEMDTQRQTFSRLSCEIHHGMAVINLRENNPEAAWEEAAKALSLAEKTGDPILRGYANRTIGDVLTELGEAPQAEYENDPDHYFRLALDAFRQLNAEAEIARTMYAQGVSLAKRGRRTAASRKLQHVMLEFSRLGMVDDAARTAEAQLALT
jgi:tetratricopeptide (TPR) repeat protein